MPFKKYGKKVDLPKDDAAMDGYGDEKKEEKPKKGAALKKFMAKKGYSC